MKKTPNKLKDFWRTFRARVVSIWLKIWQYIRYKVVPFVVRALKLIFLGAFIATIVTLTIKGCDKELTNAYKDILIVIAGTSGTVIAIFFSLILIPLNQISTRYSPRFLKYLAKDLFFILVFLFSFTTVTYSLVFLYFGASDFIVIAAAMLFLFLFVTLAASWRYIIYLSNPLHSVLQPVHNEIVKTFRKQIPRYRKHYVRSLASLPGDVQETTREVGYFKVDDSIIKYIQDNLLPIREVAIKAIKNGELEQAKNAIGVMTSVVLNYLIARKKYYNDDDPLLYFLYTEFKLLVKTSNNEPKLRLHPFMVDCWRNIGVYAAAVNVKGLPRMGGNNINNLVHYPVQGLKELCAENLAESDSTTPGDACKALGDIGIALMKEGYDHQAATIIQDLEKISLVAEKANIGVFAGNANYAIMRIYVSGLAYRNNAEKDEHNYSFGLINKTISNLLTTFLQTKRSTFDAMILNPLIGWLLDPITGINLARATEYALFSDNLNDYSLKMNMESVEWNIENLQNAIKLLEHHKDFYFGGQAYENLYQTMLVIFSYLNDEMAADHVFYYKKEPIKNDELLNKARKLFGLGLDVLISTASNSSSAMPGKDPLDILFSLYYILLYENKKKKNTALDSLFKDFHGKMKSLLADHTQGGANANSTLCKHFRLLRAVLWANKYYTLAKDFDVPDFKQSRNNMMYFESEFPEPMIGRNWGITRPTFQKNGYYYSFVETAFGFRD